MSRIGIMSDTHGYTSCLPTILKTTEGAGIDLWLHAGDVAQDAHYLATLTEVPVIAVRGNNDRGYPKAPETEYIPWEDTWVYMMHGDQLYGAGDEMELRFLARHYQTKLIVLGHTHRHNAYYIEQCLVVNPGSPVLPRDGSGGTFAIATYVNGRFTVDFIAMKDIV